MILVRVLRFIVIAALGTPGVALAFAFVGQPDNPPQELPLPAQGPGVLPVVWPDSRVTVAVTLNFDSEYTAVAVDAMRESWNAIGTRFQFQQGFTPSQTCRNNGINVAEFRQFLCDGSQFGQALAITITNYTYNSAIRRWEITDADILIDQNRNWVSRRDGPLLPGVADFHRVLIHELGHAAGLDHPDDAGQHVTAIMNSAIGDIDSLQADDIQGLSYLYGGAASTNGVSSGGSGGGGCVVFLPLLAWLRWQARRWATGREHAGYNPAPGDAYYLFWMEGERAISLSGLT
jgi:Matrixin